MPINNDIVSQLVANSQTWRAIMNLGIVNLHGGGSGGGGGMMGMFQSHFEGIYWQKNPFNCEPSELTVIQQQLINMSLAITRYHNLYIPKDVCRNCLELDSTPKDPRITILHKRVKACEKCGGDVNAWTNPNSRLQLYFHHTDCQKGDKGYFIDRKSFTIFELVSILNEHINDSITIKAHTKSKHNRKK